MDYFLLDTLPQTNPDLCILEDPPIDTEANKYRMMTGKPMGTDYPEDARIYMKGSGGITLPGLVANTCNLLIVRKEIKDLVMSHEKDSAKIECLPVQIFNHKKRLASADYFILNPLGTVDCLDLEESIIDRNKKGQIVEVEEIVLKKSKLDPRRALFRPTEDHHAYIARSDWLQKLKTLGLKVTNVFATPLQVTG